MFHPHSELPPQELITLSSSINQRTHKVMDPLHVSLLIWLISDSHSTSVLHERIVLGKVKSRFRSSMLLSNAHYQRLIATLRYHIIEWCYCFLSFFSFIISAWVRKEESKEEYENEMNQMKSKSGFCRCCWIPRKAVSRVQCSCLWLRAHNCVIITIQP